ncbi:MAG: hypothetical protein E7351_02410 [Clostridiales bacterium]|nr:hypothetical protein [Clostridiales bacterium]
MKVKNKKYDELGYALSEYKCEKHDIVDTVEINGYYHIFKIRYENKDGEKKIAFDLSYLRSLSPRFFFTIDLFSKLKKSKNVKDGIIFLLKKFPHESENIIKAIPSDILNDTQFAEDISKLVPKDENTHEC